MSVCRGCVRNSSEPDGAEEDARGSARLPSPASAIVQSFV